MKTGKINIKRALISVSDKTGLEQLGRQLDEMGVEIISTGGTLKKLKEAGIPVISVSSFTGSPEILGGRVKTLHPKVYAGILFRRDSEEDLDQMSASDYRSIDLVVVNLYPFVQTLARTDASDADKIEKIDIGGPTMLRAAAKNYSYVTVLVDPADYDSLIEQMTQNDGNTTEEFRRNCATKTFQMTAVYDTAIAGYFSPSAAGSDDSLSLNYSNAVSLRYGENPHQTAKVLSLTGATGTSLVNGELLSGKELSYNNYSDLDACLDLLLDFDQPFACLLKHANPCGAAVGDTIASAYRSAYESDPLSAFGCIIGVNRQVDIEAARIIHETPFVECVLAPSFSEEALMLLKKKKNRRLLALPAIENGAATGDMTYKHIRGGILAQSADEHRIQQSELKVVSKRKPTEEETKSLLFGWKIVKHTKSNAIVLTKGTATVGIGMGQTSRVDSAFMAVKRAGDRARGSVVASDAFFPMPDGVEVALQAGVTAVIQPGGSKGDEKVIEAVDKAGAAMIFTGVRHFKH